MNDKRSVVVRVRTRPAITYRSAAVPSPLTAFEPLALRTLTGALRTLMETVVPVLLGLLIGTVGDTSPVVAVCAGLLAAWARVVGKNLGAGPEDSQVVQRVGRNATHPVGRRRLRSGKGRSRLRPAGSASRRSESARSAVLPEA